MAGAAAAFQVRFIVLLDAADATSPAGAGGTVVHDAGAVPPVEELPVVELLAAELPGVVGSEDEELPQPEARIVQHRLNASVRCPPHRF